MPPESMCLESFPSHLLHICLNYWTFHHSAVIGLKTLRFVFSQQLDLAGCRVWLRRCPPPGPWQKDRTSHSFFLVCNCGSSGHSNVGQDVFLRSRFIFNTEYQHYRVVGQVMTYFCI